MIIAITGPTGSGKTTTSKKLSLKFGRSVNIDVDEIKHMIVNGFIYDDTQAGIEQWRLLGKNIADVVKNFEDKKYDIIVNGYLHPESWKVIENDITFDHKFLLFPAETENMDRDSSRSSEIVMGRDWVLKHREHFSGMDDHDWTRIDTTGQDIDESVSVILEKLNARAA